MQLNITEMWIQRPDDPDFMPRIKKKHFVTIIKFSSFWKIISNQWQFVFLKKI